jgi:SAM-dependent methyltransferase
MDDFDRLYRQRLASGQTGWHAGGYESFELLPLLEEMLSQSRLDPTPSHILDLGCGCGETSCFLAARGFAVTAVDVSPAAIHAAQQAAIQRSLHIDFRVADVSVGELPRGPFDVVLDGQLLHCIVDLADRANLLARIRGALRPGGELWSETMVGRARVSTGSDWRLDEEGVFWKARPGEDWQPVRRIQPSVERLCDELRTAGFEVVWYAVEAPVQETDVQMLRSRWRLHSASD